MFILTCYVLLLASFGALSAAVTLLFFHRLANRSHPRAARADQCEDSLIVFGFILGGTLGSLVGLPLAVAFGFPLAALFLTASAPTLALTWMLFSRVTRLATHLLMRLFGDSD